MLVMIFQYLLLIFVLQYVEADDEFGNNGKFQIYLLTYKYIDFSLIRTQLK